MFITFEGGEAAGKSTQVKLVTEHLEAQGRRVVALREPGGTPLGEEVRRLLLHREAPLSDKAELLLFLAARAELVRSVIRPALDESAIVISDRFTDSTLAYQGYGRGIEVDAIRHLNAWATDGLTPDLTVLLDLSVEESRKRRHAEAEDAIESAGDAFHRRVREGYLALSQAEPSRWLVLDGTQGVEEIALAIAARVEALLAER